MADQSVAEQIERAIERELARWMIAPAVRRRVLSVLTRNGIKLPKVKNAA